MSLPRDEEKRLVLAARSHDIQAWCVLLEVYRPAISKLAQRVARKAPLPNDAVIEQELLPELHRVGFEAFQKVIHDPRYDPEKELAPYAFKTIEWSMLTYLREQVRGLLSRPVLNDLGLINATLKAFLNDQHRRPAADELAAHLAIEGLTTAHLQEYLDLRKRFADMDDQETADEEASSFFENYPTPVQINPGHQLYLCQELQTLYDTAYQVINGEDRGHKWIVLFVLKGERKRNVWPEIADDLRNPKAVIGQPAGEDHLSPWETLCLKAHVPEQVNRPWPAIYNLFRYEPPGGPIIPKLIYVEGSNASTETQQEALKQSAQALTEEFSRHHGPIVNIVRDCLKIGSGDAPKQEPG